MCLTAMYENRLVSGVLRACWQSLVVARQQTHNSSLSYPAVLASDHLLPSAHVSYFALLNAVIACSIETQTGA